MLKPTDLVTGARGVIVLGSLLAAFLMLGPFQGAEQAFGLTDKQAHAIAFYVFTTFSFLAAPRMRRSDLALAALALGAAAEVAQIFTGRSASISDFSADVAGVACAWLPAQMEQLRRLAREHPGLSFRQIRGRDRRKAPARAPAPAGAAERPAPLELQN